MLGSPVRKLIIVSGDKENVYAELLSSLISLKNDDRENNKIIGIKDGSIEAVVWDEKIYNDNKAQLGSNTKLVFVGKNKSSEKFIPSIRFDKGMKMYGINVGCLVNKAVVFTQPNILLNSQTLYDDFFEKYTELTKQFDDNIADTDAIIKATITDGVGVALDKGARAVGGFLGSLFRKKGEKESESTENLGTDFFDFGSKAEANKLIPSQMYRYAILSFYLNRLSDSMEIKK